MGLRLADYYTNISLTGSQAEAVRLVEQFLQGNEAVFILKGYAGTGKTFLLGRLSRYLNDVGCTYCYVAPTGRAAKVLRRKTGGSATTIHSLIYELDSDETKLDVEEDDYKLFFRLKPNKDPLNAVYIVDEASMVSDSYSDQETFKFGTGKLLSDFIEYAGKRKLIFMGDYAQLPPVNSRFSPALSKTYLRETYNLPCVEYELTDVYRQAQDSGILQASMVIREAIQRERYDGFAVEANGKDITEIAIEQSLETFGSRWSSSDEESAIVIAHSNEKVYRYNRAIRQHLGFDKNEVAPGDQLLVVKNTVAAGYPLFNGDFVRVEQVDSSPVLKPVRLRGVSDPVLLRFRGVTISFTGSNGDTVRVYVNIFENLLHSQDREMTSLERRAFIADFHSRHPGIHRHQSLLIDKLKQDPYFNALHVKFGYAVTCHKSQGGEWKHVIVDFRYSSSVRSEQYFRWAYTAMTRAKAALYAIYPPQHQFHSDELYQSEEVRKRCDGITEQLRLYNWKVTRADYFQHQFILTIQTMYGEQRAALHYNAKYDVTSVRLLETIHDVDDRMLLTLLESWKTAEPRRVDKTQAQAQPKAKSEPVPKEEQQRPLAPSGAALKQKVETAVVPYLLTSIPGYTFSAVTEHQNAVKLSGYAQSGEIVLNAYFNKKGVFTKLHTEKGTDAVPESVVEHIRQLLGGLRL